MGKYLSSVRLRKREMKVGILYLLGNRRYQNYMINIKKIFKIALIAIIAILSCQTSNAQSEEAKKHFKEGEENFLLHNFSQAYNEYSEAIRFDPNYKEAYQALGDVIKEWERNYESAISKYDQVIRIDPNNVRAYLARGKLYLFEIREYAKASFDYSQVIRLDPTNAIAYSDRAFSYRMQNSYDLAIKDYNESIRLGNNDYKYRGTVYLEKGDTTQAIKDYNEYVLKEKNASSLVSRARFYAKIKKNNLAFNDFDEAIKLDPNLIEAYTERGEYYKNNHQYDLAIADYTKVIEIDPKYCGRGYLLRGDIQKQKGLYQLALKDYEAQLKLDEGDTYVYVKMLSPLVRTGQFEQAKKYIESFFFKEGSSYSIIIHKEWQFYKFYLSAISTDLPNKQYDNALINLEKAVADFFSNSDNELQSQYTDILALKGYVLVKLSRLAEAKEVYEQALVINNFQPDVKEALIAIQKQQSIIADTDKIIPEIQLISPRADRGLRIVSNNQTIQLIGKAKDASGIASVKINGGILAKVEEDGLFIAPVTLKQGENSILITATDKQGNKSSKTFSITGSVIDKQIDASEEIVMPTTAEAAPQYHAILIASEDYVDSSIPDLENPVKDASELKSILESNYTFNSKNIETLYNKSREEIMQAIVQKSNSLTENDNLLIFYAGHGIAEKDKFGDVDGYWIPSSAKKGLNASYISSDDINKALKRSNAKHILVIADACFSGAFTRELPADASVGVQKQYSVPSRKIMASGNMEPVPDNSRFIFYLKKNLKENKEKYLTSKKLFDGFYEAILNNSDTSPQYAAIKNVGDEGGEFVFIKK